MKTTHACGQQQPENRQTLPIRDAAHWARVHLAGDRNPPIRLPSRERTYPKAERGPVVGHG